MNDPYTPTEKVELARLQGRKNIPHVSLEWSHTQEEERERIRTVEAELARLAKK